MSPQEIFDIIDKDFDRIQDGLLYLFGDEGHDIGDASNAYELLANVTDGGHQSYTIPQVLKAISNLSHIPYTELKPLRRYTDQQWNDLYTPQRTVA